MVRVVHTHLLLSPSDNLPEPKETIEGDTKTVVSYKVQEGKVKKVPYTSSMLFSYTMHIASVS